MLEQDWIKILRCPYCKIAPIVSEQGANCERCGYFFERTDSGALDMRINHPKKYTLDFDLFPDGRPNDDIEFLPLVENRTPKVDFAECRVPFRLTKEIMSYFPRARNKESLMLDLGCGDTAHKEVCETAGFKYVGLDYRSSEANLLGDAHALPFEDASFDFVLSIAVLHYLRYPFVAIREIHRVLKPKGFFIGTVAFLEPFTDSSSYQYTHLGTYSMLKFGGFNIYKIAPSDNWSVLTAVARMGLFPKMPRKLRIVSYGCWMCCEGAG